MISRALRADGALVIVALAWGLTFPLIELSVRDTDPVWFVSIRMLIASIILLPFVYKKLSKVSRRVWLGAVILGFTNGATYLCQTIGLQTTTSAMSGFITGTNVIMVPLLLPFFRLGLPRRIDLAGCFLCLIGLYVLNGASWHHIGIGELWTLGAAAFYAFSIVLLQRVSSDTEQVLELAFLQIAFVIPWMVLAALIMHHPLHLNATSWLSVVITAVLSTSLALVLQTKFQRETTPTHAVIIFSLEPIFAALLGWLIVGEPITLNIAEGGGLILLSLLMVELLPKIWRRFAPTSA
jgi:drug/metabolite transporter (DMT)-like permease